MIPELIFIVVILLFAGLVSIFIKRTKNNEESKRSRLKDIGLAVGVIIIITVLALLINATFIKDSEASDFSFLDRTSVQAGLQLPLTGTTNVCTPGENSLASDLSVQADILSYNDLAGIGGSYTHNSCVIGSDEDVYDGAGVYAFFQPVEPLLIQAGVDWNIGNNTICNNDGNIFNGRANLELYRYDRISTGVGYTVHQCFGGTGTHYHGAGLFLKLDFWNR